MHLWLTLVNFGFKLPIILAQKTQRPPVPMRTMNTDGSLVARRPSSLVDRGAVCVFTPLCISLARLLRRDNATEARKIPPQCKYYVMVLGSVCAHVDGIALLNICQFSDSKQSLTT